MARIGEQTILSIPVNQLPDPCCWDYLSDWQSFGEGMNLKCRCERMYKTERVAKDMIVTEDRRVVEIALSKKVGAFTSQADAQRWADSNWPNAVLRETRRCWIVKVLPWDWADQGSAKVVKVAPGVMRLVAQIKKDYANVNPSTEQLRDSDSRQFEVVPRTVIE